MKTSDHLPANDPKNYGDPIIWLMLLSMLIMLGVYFIANN